MTIEIIVLTQGTQEEKTLQLHIYSLNAQPRKMLKE